MADNAQRSANPRRLILFTAVAIVGVTLWTLFDVGGGEGQSAERNAPMAPELEPNKGWLNTHTPLRFSDELKGHVVVLDFWTFCCINCMHVLPDLEYLEEKYADDPVIVIGVHSAKFTGEAERAAIRDAMFRYDIHHPVVIDDEMNIWRRFGVRAWPTFIVIGTDGRAIPLPRRSGGYGYAVSGEGNRNVLDEAIGLALEDGRRRGTIASTTFDVQLDAAVSPASGLAYPGKVLADRVGQRLFIADSSNDRILVCSYPDGDGRCVVRHVFGNGERGFADGDIETPAQFNDPHGMALSRDGTTLYVADVKNHAIRAIDLETQRVRTLVGNGTQTRDYVGGGGGRAQGLGSPWALELDAPGGILYVAMAGTHQLWSVDVKPQVASAIAGSGRETLYDGPAADAALAQPSGLALSSDGDALYFADSETSSVRRLDLRSNDVTTIVGEGLFDFGDVDGNADVARLQHPLGVALLPTPDGDRLLIADTYNDKIKVVDPAARTSNAWTQWGTTATLNHPGGLDLVVDEGGAPSEVFIADTNNHRIVRVTPDGAQELMLEFPSASRPLPDEVRKVDASVDISAKVSFQIDATSLGTPNPEAPCTVVVSSVADGRVLLQRTRAIRAFPVDIAIEGLTPGAWRIDLSYAACDDGDLGVCRPVDVTWVVVAQTGGEGVIRLGTE